MSLRKIEGDGNVVLGAAEYIWVDKDLTLRSKAKTIEVSLTSGGPVPLLPHWSFDGSSTGQAEGDSSDLMLSPANYTTDPFRGGHNFLVLCEVRNADGSNHKTNHRAKLRAMLDAGGSDLRPWWGFEQEYFLFRPELNPKEQDNQKILGGIVGWPKRKESGFQPRPRPQGPYYCGVGADRVAGRAVVEDHMKACLQAGLLFCGINAEVALGQWEYQIGYRGFTCDEDELHRATLQMCDHLWLSRWILQRIGEDHNLAVSFHPKPVSGDWNGSGMHTNFSTEEMRDAGTGQESIARVVEALEKNHAAHIEVYGADNEQRLTGDHETSTVSEFRSGDLDRGASIRIPLVTRDKRCGYIEDRRPASNADPYLVCERILHSVLGPMESVPLSQEDTMRYQSKGLHLVGDET